MNRMRVLFVSFILLFSIHIQATWWQTTQGLRSSGSCILEDNSIHITVNRFFVDVEEEAVIKAEPASWFSGDSTTLEISGRFHLASGAALRSLILWNGETILKAKLKDRAAADSAYEDVVDPDNSGYSIRHDPVIVEYEGNNYYRFKMFPVTLNGSRRIRILYTVPVVPVAGCAGFKINTAFVSGSFREMPKTIPVTIDVPDSGGTMPFYLQTGNNGKKREIASDGTYLVSVNELMYYNPCWIKGPPLQESWVVQHSIDDSVQKGNYNAFMLPVYEAFQQFKNSVKDSLQDIIDDIVKDSSVLMDLNIDDFGFEAVVTFGEKEFILNASDKTIIMGFLKSEEEWDGEIRWNVYNSDGDKCFTTTLTVPVVDNDEASAMLPLIWAVRYSLKEQQGNLGALFGFVDEEMSLLALESDSIPADESQQWEEGGVPRLLPEEIIVGAEIPSIPEESMFFEDEYDTKITSATADMTETMNVTILYGNRVQIILPDMQKHSSCSILLFDLKGRLVFKSMNHRVIEKSIVLQLPSHLKGTYILHVKQKSSVGLIQKVIIQ